MHHDLYSQVQMKFTLFWILIIAIAYAFILDQSMNSQVYGIHFGDLRIYSNVYTGGGNTSMPLNEFDPIKKEIFAGESIKWSNPTAGRPYPHMVVFLSNTTDEQLKLKISNITKSLNASSYESLINNLNKLMKAVSNEKDNESEIFNARSILLPSVINSSSQQTVFYLDPEGSHLFKGAVYNMTGQEPYVNSGPIWAGGTVPGNFSKIYSFIVTFKNVGTYNYQCLLHPDMEGTVIVKPNPGRLGIQIS